MTTPVSSIQALAHLAQQRIQIDTGSSIKRTHTYELLASFFGYRSYAALRSESVFTKRRISESAFEQHRLIVQQRCVDLGCGPIAAVITSTLSTLLAEHRIGVIKLTELVASLRALPSTTDQNTLWDRDETQNENTNHPDDQKQGVAETSHAQKILRKESLVSAAKNGDALAINALRLLRRYESGEPPTILLKGLESTASEGSALAHYALALLQQPYCGSKRAQTEFMAARQPPFEAFAGVDGNNVEQQWIDDVDQESARTEKYMTHLRAAVRLGNSQARLDSADHLGDAKHLDEIQTIIADDPLKIAEIAQRLGRDDDARQVLTAAAELGNLDAMRYLVDVYDRENPTRYRMWFYLARLFGSDLSPSDKYLLHRLRDTSWFDASEKNDDAASELSLELPKITIDEDREARKTAEELFANRARRDSASTDSN